MKYLPDKATQVLCPVCSVKLIAIWSEGEFSAEKCPKCGLILSMSATPFQFDERYFEHYVDSTEERVRHFRHIIAHLPVNLEAPILDVGAGVGFFIRALPPDLAQATTLVEPSDFARRYLRETPAAAIFSSLEEIPLDYPPFATVTFWDVLAHVENPVEKLVRARGLMLDGGLLIIKTPYHPLRLFRAARLLAPIGKGRSLLHIPSMRTHFTPQSLQALLRATGFQAIFWQWASEPPLTGHRGSVLLKGFLLHLGRRLATRKISFVTAATSA